MKVSTTIPIRALFILLIFGILQPGILFSQVYINEIMASNATVHADLDFGAFCDWIELYNSGDQDIDLSGYFLSDDPANPGMWPFPAGTILAAHDFLVIYADGSGDGLHANFSLAKEGELVLLSNPQSRIVDSFRYPYQLTDISFGRSGADLQLRGYFTSPTPWTMNDVQVVSGISSQPVFSLEAGFYAGSRSLEISTLNAVAVIHYTLDGREPTEISPIYVDPIEIVQTTVLRVRTFEADKLPGLVVTNTYFIDEPQNLPVISLATDPDHFFSDETGIYVQGTAGVPGYCTSVPHNVNQDWERPVNIELIEKDGTRGLNQLAGVKIYGGCSRVRYPMKSLALFARKEYESSSFKYRLFPDKANDKYETFILRASADDQPFTLFRDPLTQMLVKDVIDVDIQAYRPVVVYINGAYWGIHNLREKINENYPDDNFGVNPDSVDLLTKNPEDAWNVIAGDAVHYNAMMDYLRENDISLDTHLEYIKTRMDMDEYINYQIIQIFFGGRDWPGNNIKFWRSKERPYNKWRWIIYDLDHHFKEYFSDIMEEATEVDCGCSWPNPPWSTYLFRRLLENESFKHEFTQRFAIYSSTHFSRERLHQFIDDLQAELAPEIPRHIERWGDQRSDLPDNTWMSPIFNSVSKWESNVQVLKDFTDTRHEIAMKHVNDYFGISGFAGLEANIEPAGTGSIKVGGTLVPDHTFSGEFSIGELLTLTTDESSGYMLSHWQLDSLVSHDTSLITKGDQWSYLISRNIPDTSWTATGYDDSSWESGMAQLGYGDGDEATIVDFGGDPANKFITTWFRKKFTIEDPGVYRRYTLNLLRDDGARIFVNGLEMIRNNMQRWSVGSQATAQGAITGADESVWLSYGLNPSMFRSGDNVVAVEIHQSSVTSSDLSFDLELVARSNESGVVDTLFEKVLQLDLQEDMKITAVMVPDTVAIKNVFINEVMASNENGLMDEMGEYEDWIEFYNSGEESVDLGGLYLTDRLHSPEPWRFPSDQPDLTSIEAFGYLVVYADKEIAEGPLHTNFKLSKAGEEVVLLQQIGQDTLLIDHLLFGVQWANITFGRYPDGSPVFELMTMSTPRATNIYTSVVQEPDPTSQMDQAGVMVYPVPTRGPLHIRFDETLVRADMPVDIRIYSITGRAVANSQHHTSSIINLSLDEHPEGMYVIRITTGDKVFVRQVVLQH